MIPPAVEAKIKPVVFSLVVLFFAVRVIQMIVEVSTQLSLPAATLYMLDYNFYFGTRIFIGSILTLLTDHVTYQQIFAVNIAVYIATILSFTALGIHSIKKAFKEDNTLLLLIVLLFFACPFSMVQYAGWVGTYDIYLCLFAVLCCITADTQKLHWLCPALCVMAIFTHYSFIFAFFPAVLSVQVYLILKKKSKGLVVSTVTGFAASFISGVYCVFFADSTIKMTRDELISYMRERLGTEPQNLGYIDAYYFEKNAMSTLDSFRENLSNGSFITTFILAFLPVVILLVSLWCYHITKSQNKQIIARVMFVLSAAAGVLLPILLVEAPRWQAAATLSQFLIFFILVKNKDEILNDWLQKYNKPWVVNCMAAFVLFNLAATVIIKPFIAV